MARNRVLAATVPIVVALGLLWVCTAMVGASIGELEFAGFPDEIGFTGEEVRLDGWLQFNEKEHPYATNIRLWVTNHEGRVEPDFIEGPLYDGERVPITVYLRGVAGEATVWADDPRCPRGKWTIQLVPEAEVHAEANCSQDPIIYVASGDGGELSCRFTATSQYREQVIAIEDTTTLEPYSHTLEMEWGEELACYGTYTFTWDVAFLGQGGSHAEHSRIFTQTCNTPQQPSLTAHADCTQARINVTSDDGGQLTYQFAATSEDGQQVVEIADVKTVEPGSHTIEQNWGEELGRKGVYTVTWDVVFHGNYGSHVEDQGTSHIVCKPEIAARADCAAATMTITTTPDYGGQITYSFIATSADGQQVVEVAGAKTVEPGSHTVEETWGEGLCRDGIYAITWDVAFQGNDGSHAEDQGTSHIICKPEIAARADCIGATMTITTTPDYGGQITYNFTATSADDQQIVEIKGVKTVGPGSHTIEETWDEELDRYGDYTLSGDVQFRGDDGCDAEARGVWVQTCNVEQCHFSSVGDSVYRIDASAFPGYTYSDKYRDAARLHLNRVTSPPAPVGWNQPGFVPDSSWQPASEVWSPWWAAPNWSPLPYGAQSLGLLDENGDQEALNGTTYLYRRTVAFAPPEPGMQVISATLEMWSDNKTEWFWQGNSVMYGREGAIGKIPLFPDHIGLKGGTYVLAVQNSNDRMCGDDDRNCNPHGTAWSACVFWRVTRGPSHSAYLPVILKVQR